MHDPVELRNLEQITSRSITSGESSETALLREAFFQWGDALANRCELHRPQLATSVASTWSWSAMLGLTVGLLTFVGVMVLNQPQQIISTPTAVHRNPSAEFATWNDDWDSQLTRATEAIEAAHFVSPSVQDRLTQSLQAELAAIQGELMAEAM